MTVYPNIIPKNVLFLPPPKFEVPPLEYQIAICPLIYFWISYYVSFVFLSDKVTEACLRYLAASGEQLGRHQHLFLASLPAIPGGITSMQNLLQHSPDIY